MLKMYALLSLFLRGFFVFLVFLSILPFNQQRRDSLRNNIFSGFLVVPCSKLHLDEHNVMYL